MNDQEYEKALAEALKDIPEEFHSPIRSIAWDRGHSSGYNEVVMIAQNLAFTLAPAIKSFESRIKNP